jgi:hypothetical protein
MENFFHFIVEQSEVVKKRKITITVLENKDHPTLTVKTTTKTAKSKSKSGGKDS